MIAYRLCIDDFFSFSDVEQRLKDFFFARRRRRRRSQRGVVPFVVAAAVDRTPTEFQEAANRAV